LVDFVIKKLLLFDSRRACRVPRLATSNIWGFSVVIALLAHLSTRSWAWSTDFLEKVADFYQKQNIKSFRS